MRRKPWGVGTLFRLFSLFRSDYTLLKLLVLLGFRCSHLRSETAHVIPGIPDSVPPLFSLLLFLTLTETLPILRVISFRDFRDRPAVSTVWPLQLPIIQDLP